MDCSALEGAPVRKSAAVSCEKPQDDAATAMQKMYRGYRTRRQLADCACLAKDYGWWNVVNGVVLSKKTAQDDPPHRWIRAGREAAKVGRGLFQDEKAKKLAFQHWLEAIDVKHRYGHNLRFYFNAWERSGTKERFFTWLDAGEGRYLDLEECPRTVLMKEQICYLSPKKRKEYEVTIQDGRLIYTSCGKPLDTDEGRDKWIFVMDTNGKLYVGRKVRGKFQHSSFLAGGAVKAAGRLRATDGVLKSIEGYSGHYLPTQEEFNSLLNELSTRGVDLSTVETKFLPREGKSISKLMVEDDFIEKKSPDTEDDCFAFCRSILSFLTMRLSWFWTVNPLRKFRRQKSWCTEGGARLSSLSVIPHNVRTKALEQVNGEQTNDRGYG
ncbi:IQ domain-containing protein IQM5-like [Selaginella moellendorffii]|uniref:IQ domain-containing protein IQM5-like n=1 Tax=Selaginella moellendorffii TaxID=88036 RepID=UPI000D1CF6F5|nr:IQ domain-containing protein IQM5-like [Selaginella moellendorffii]|eukprot:XP_024521977.1 IQ domain-containing protein IQM5-like [Selaginella moellendorffii]